MKLRTLLLLAGGILLGYKLAQRMHEDDPYVVKGRSASDRLGPRSASSGPGAASRRPSERAEPRRDPADARGDPGSLGRETT